MNLFGETTEEEIYQRALSDPLDEKVRKAIALIRLYEAKALQYSPEGYYVAFSGGKDSIVMAKLFEMSGCKYQLWYNNTTIDPPELVWFIKLEYPQARWNNPEMHMTRYMVDKCKGPPTRMGRWCCEIYKERGGVLKFKAIGVRAPESPRRKGRWRTATKDRKTGVEILCPILYWTDSDVWSFIRQNNIPYCSLYDEGYKRLGCIGCPMSGPNGVARDFKRWPRYAALWRRGIERFWAKWHGVPTRKGEVRYFEKFGSAEGMWQWWISGEAMKDTDQPDCQMMLW